MNQIKIGDYVSIRPCFGIGELTTVKITHLTRTDFPRVKFGAEVDAVDESTIHANCVVLSYDLGGPHGGRWAYGEQVVAWCCDSAA